MGFQVLDRPSSNLVSSQLITSDLVDPRSRKRSLEHSYDYKLLSTADISASSNQPIKNQTQAIYADLVLWKSSSTMTPAKHLATSLLSKASSNIRKMNFLRIHTRWRKLPVT